MVQLRIITDQQDFSFFENDWNGLLQRSNQDNPFLTHQWLFSWWQAFGTEGKLHLLLFYEIEGNSERLVGGFPGYIHSDRLLPIRKLRFLGSNVVCSVFLDMIVNSGKEEMVYDAFISYLEKQQHFVYAELTNILEGSKFLERMRNLNASKWKAIRIDSGKLGPFIELPESVNAFFENISKKTRKTYRNAYNKLIAKNMQLEVVHEPGKISEAIEDFARLHNLRRKAKGDQGIFASDAQIKFYNMAFDRFASAGWLEISFIKIGEERVAGGCQFIYRKSVYYYSTGYNIALDKDSVGTVINGLLIERAINGAKSFYEYLLGNQQYKYRYGVTGERILIDLILVKYNLLAQLYQALREINAYCRSLIKKMLGLLVSCSQGLKLIVCRYLRIKHNGT